MKQWILDTARTTFERFGFEPIETSAVQKTEVLTGGEADSQKIIFNVRGSQEEISDPLRRDEDETSTSLRFDLTVPLARFVAANPEIPKPFKRYEIGRVWRGERQQAGRYREFTQADADIVGSDSPSADAEIVAVIYTTLKNLGLNEFVIKINDRRELDALPSFAGFPEEKIWDALRVIDKKDKIGESGVAEELEKIFGDSIAPKIIAFLADQPSVGGTLAEITQALEALGVPARYWKIDRSMVRGLSYYTGPIFEAVLTSAPEIGSIFGGGRYDNLIMSLTGQKIPAVGASLGVDRLIAAMQKLGRSWPPQRDAQVLILDLAAELKPEYIEMARRLREKGVNASVYLGDERSFQGQLAYAVKKEFAYAVIYGAEEKQKSVVAVKNLLTREQKEVPREKIVEYFLPS